tara:strand:- start:197 stop:544 length:348 start_codon:yes stop_codon:yes gene_type:complete
MACSKYNGGMLREPIAIERNARVSDGAGGYTASWAALADSPTRAAVKATSGSERYASGRTEAQAQFRCVTRYFEGLLEADRIVFRGKAHNITFIDNVDMADRWLVISLSGGVAIA